MGSYWDHSATLIWDNGKPYIVEAKGGEKIKPKYFYKWLSERPDNHFGVSPAVVSIGRIESQYGKGYDYKSALLYMPIHKITGVWVGPVRDKAAKEFFCFELTAWYRGIDNWWECVPQMIEKQTVLN